MKKHKEKKHYVYSLVDPIDLKIKYIGRSYNLSNRIKHHYCPNNIRGNDKFDVWIQLLNDQGLKPQIKILKEFDNYDLSKKWEIIFIKKLYPQLFNIQNYTYNHKEHMRAYYIENKDKIKKQQKEYYQKNKDKIIKYKRDRRKALKELEANNEA